MFEKPQKAPVVHIKIEAVSLHTASMAPSLSGPLLAAPRQSCNGQDPTIGGIGRAISTLAYPLHLGAGFSTSGWLAVLLTFVLARVFAAGTLMREDLDGTV